MTEDEIEKLGHLSRVSLSREDCHHFVGKLSQILNSFSVVRAIEVKHEAELMVPRTRSDLREDRHSGGCGQELALKNAPQKHDGHFRVPAVL